MIGSKLGDYEILRLIGKGGMGAVYEAVKPSINRRVAIKVLLPEYAERDDVVRRFLNEAKAVNAVNHPGVVQISDVGTSPTGSLYLVMEYLDGQTLAERLQSSRGKFTESETINIGWQLAGVLAAAHAKSIIHRDLKPGNVMIVPDMAGPGGERVKLLDFGIAKLGAVHQTGEEVNTRTGQIMGTAAYMSPEQFGGHKAVDGQSDVYSLACLMFRLLTGQQPFISDSGEMAVAAMHMFKPAPMDVLALNATPWLVTLIESMMRKEPTERPTMAQVALLFQEQLPDYAQSRKSMPGLAGRSSDPSMSGKQRSLDTLLKSLPEVAAVSSDPLGLSRSSQPGTISRASGQATVKPERRSGARLLMFLATLAVLGIFGGGTALLLRPRNTTVPAPAPVVTPPVLVPVAAAPVGDGGAPEKPVAAVPVVPVPAISSDPDPEPAPTPSSRRDRTAVKASKSGSRQSGKSRSRTSHATQIIN